MLKKIFLFFLLISEAAGASAQCDSLSYFNEGWENCIKDSAKYYRQACYNPFGELDGPFNDFYMSGKLQNEGEFVNGVENDLFVWYYENGQRKEEAFYDKGVFEILNSWNEKGLQEVKNGTGKRIYRGLDGRPETEGNYVNATQEGEWKWYRRNGKIKQIAFYKEGKLEGVDMFFDENGDTLTTGTYKNGRQEGIWKYYEKGKLIETANYKNGLKDGYFYYFYPDGKTAIRQQYERDELREEKYYFPNGKLKYEAEYVDGVYLLLAHYDSTGNIFREGNYDYKINYATGELHVEGKFRNGKAEGVWLSWYKNGSRKDSCNYKNGLLNGTCYYWFKNHPNQLQCIGTYKKNKKNGEWKWFYEDGKIKKKCFYKDDLLKGEFINFYKNGNIKSREYYIDNRLHGIAFYYFQSGKKLYESTFQNGRIQGSFKEYSREGRLIYEGEYRNGEMFIKNSWNKDGSKGVINGSGEFKRWHPNGQLMDQGILKEYKRQGDWDKWDQNGVLIEKISYNYETNIRTDSSWYNNGSLRAAVAYKEGEKNGTWIFYYKDGKKRQQLIFNKGMLLNEKNYNRDGTLKEF